MYQKYIMYFCLIIIVLISGSISRADTWEGLLKAADSLTNEGQYDSAVVKYKSALEVVESEYGTEDTAVAKILNSLGSSLIFAGKFEEAEAILNRSLIISEETVGPNHHLIGFSLDRLAAIYQNQALFDKAEPLIIRALEIAEDLHGEYHKDVASALHNLAGLYHEQAKYSEAEPLYKKALLITEDVLGSEHMDMASTLNGLALLYEAQGRFEEAESIYVRTLEIGEKNLGPNHPTVGTFVNNLASFYTNMGNYLKAEKLFGRAHAISEETYDHNHPELARSLNNLGMIYYFQGKYRMAEPYYVRALTIIEKHLGSLHPDFAMYSSNLGVLYYKLGNYANAVNIFRRVVDILELAYGPDHPDVAQAINTLAQASFNDGKVFEAEVLFEQALAIYEKLLGPDHPDVATSLDYIVGLYSYQRKFEKAEVFCRRALEIRQNTYGPDSPHLASSLDKLALLNFEQENFQIAESLYTRVVAIRKNSVGTDHPSFATALNNLAYFYKSSSRFEESAKFFKRALSIKERVLGQSHAEIAEILRGLGDTYIEQGLYSKAEQILEKAQAIIEKSYGVEHMKMADIYKAKAKLKFKQNKVLKSLQNSFRAFKVMSNDYNLNGSVLSEKDAMSYVARLLASVNRYLSYCYDADSLTSDGISQTAEIVFHNKGLVSDALFKRQKSLVNEQDSTIRELAESLRYTRFQLSNLFVKGPGEDVDGYRNKIDSLNELASILETDLSRSSVSFRKYKDYQNITSDRISSILPKKSALIEFMRYDYLQIDHDSIIPKYLAAIVNANTDAAVINLGNADIIDTLLTEYRNHILSISQLGHAPTDVEKSRYTQISNQLYNKLIAPLENHIKQFEMVLIAPDGALNLIPFAGLIDDNGKYLIEKYPIHYLSAGRDLIRLNDETESGNGLLAMGNPDFDASIDARLGSDDSVYLASVETNPYQTRNVRSGCGNLREIKSFPLPHTLAEISNVTTFWNGIKDDSAVVFLGGQASEDNFKANAFGKKVIHLATHGYFLEGLCNSEQSDHDFSIDRGFVGENPLLLSGLLFAGSNLHGEGADSAGLEDGYLSAYEVSAMDLNGTDMVVLSACETGLGEVKQGEGVYGLRRAFQLAGARTVVSSLWQVPDKTTAEMMSQLYRESNRPIYERIRAMQLSRIKELREDGFSDHPYNWAAFIAIGGWR